LDKGECIAMYPEGTIPAHAPKMKAFKNWEFKMAVDQKLPIVPITFQQNYKIMLEPSNLFEYSLPHAVRTVVHAPIDTKDMTDSDIPSLRKSVFSQIESGLESNL
jgi:1-acyl-sn-glycerol-3-phosphate acyltransferase